MGSQIFRAVIVITIPASRGFLLELQSPSSLGFFAARKDCGENSMVESSKRRLYSFTEARKIARGHGFSNKQEFLDYECPGAYQLPKNPQEVWSEEWSGWDDWLGIPWPFTTAREIARRMKLGSEEEYLELISEKKYDNTDFDRLPYRPNLFYKSEWFSWEDWLGLDER